MFFYIVTGLTLLCICCGGNCNQTGTANRYSFYFNQPPSSSNNANCQDRRGNRGICVPLQNCAVLREHFRKNPRNFYGSSSDYSCMNGPSFVCCPTSQQLISLSTSSTESNYRPPGRPSATTSWGIPDRGEDSWNRPASTSTWGRPDSGAEPWKRPSTEAWGRPSTETWGRPSTESWGRPSTESWSRPSTSSWGRPESGEESWNRPSTASWGRPSDSEDIFWGKPTTTASSKPEPWIITSTSRPSGSRAPSTASTLIRPTTPSTSGGSGGGGRTSHRNRKLLPEDKCGLDLAQKILGGKEAGLDELPWMALLRLKMASGRTLFMCGGSLINSRYVLTAAHCLKGGDIPSSAIIDQVRLGEHNIDKPMDCGPSGKPCNDPDDVDVEERIPHPNYNPKDPASLNDIALLRLKRDAKLSLYVQPICLPMDSLATANYDGKKLLVAGWGRTANVARSNSPVKLKVELPVVPFGQCAPNYRKQRVNLQENSQMCAGGEAGKDSCQGDSGGPLMSLDTLGSEIRWHVTGIVSFGPQDCGEKNKPAIYTRVGQYVDWILDNMRE